MTERILFGPFQLFPTKRMLLKGTEIVQLGSRALDILIVLTERPGELISQKDLLARVWPDLFVEEANLRVHVAAIRKALEEGRNGTRYIATIPARGYCFVAEVERETAAIAEAGMCAARPVTKVKCRSNAIGEIADLVTSHRFVSITGPGGMGKTQSAIAVERELSNHFEGATRFIDLSAISDPDLISSAIARALDSSLEMATINNLTDVLNEEKQLLVLDNCEHIIEAIVEIAEHILAASPSTHLLATSREVLRGSGERVYRLRSLRAPSIGEDLETQDALAFEAVELFMECAIASGHSGDLSDREAQAVAEMCRLLDGVPLAIECVASRVGVHGIEATAEMLIKSPSQLWLGRRNAPGRHQSLHASLRWSIDLLQDRDFNFLCRLAVFREPFTLIAAQEVAVDLSLDHYQVAGALERLVDKSVILSTTQGPRLRYRLPHLTRAYLLETMAADATGSLASSGIGIDNRPASPPRPAAPHRTIMDQDRECLR